jgi:nicotinamide mononucleotide transporter
MTESNGDLFIEILGAVTGLIYLYFSIRQIIWLWPWGIVTSAIYIYVFFKAGLYADMSLQVYYLFISVYGWYYWTKGDKSHNLTDLPVTQAKRKVLLFLLIIWLVLTSVIGFFLDKFTDSPLPFLDAFTASGSIIATWMLARKLLENWIFWIIIDAVSILMYIYKELYPTVILFLVYTILAFLGYIQWKRGIIKNSGI